MGLDISTSMVGVCILDERFNIVLMTHIDFKHHDNTLWDKADHAIKVLTDTLITYSVDRVWVEEPLQRFTPGMSSAATIMTLSKFNGLLSYAVRNHQHRDPEFVGANDARRTCGIKLLRKKQSGGKDYKTQAFDWCAAGPLKGVQFPLTKTGKVKPWVMDETDAYIIARAGLILMNTPS